MNLEKIGKVFTNKFVGTGPSSYDKRIYRAAVSQRLRNTDLKNAYTEFHKYPTNGLVADTRSQTNGRGLHIRRPVLVRKEHLISNEVE